MPKISLSYFAAGGGVDPAASPYDLLLDSARLADEAGLEAVWLPERHFGDFGYPYPNPSVLAAAVAATTRRIGIRAGSVVMPLHHPVRVAEEWAVVDQLSRGRAGLSFASGWHGRDFILARSDVAERRPVMQAGIDAVRALWRGEARRFPDPAGQELEVRTMPRPVQPELPTWLTSGGSVSTFQLAGSLRAGVLTHLVGQDPAQLAANIAAYRASHEQAGGGRGWVTLMIHTHILDGSRSSADRARAELARYLQGSMKLDESNVADSAGAGAFRAMSDADRRAIAELGSSRFLGNSLVCTVDEVHGRLAAMESWGADEVSCLIDFGFDHSSIMKSLDDLLTILA
jgi:natural product biosynthesis luciferase-like monooxygenase protein